MNLMKFQKNILELWTDYLLYYIKINMNENQRQFVINKLLSLSSENKQLKQDYDNCMNIKKKAASNLMSLVKQNKQLKQDYDFCMANNKKVANNIKNIKTKHNTDILNRERIISKLRKDLGYDNPAKILQIMKTLYPSVRTINIDTKTHEYNSKILNNAVNNLQQYTGLISKIPYHFDITAGNIDKQKLFLIYFIAKYPKYCIPFDITKHNYEGYLLYINVGKNINDSKLIYGSNDSKNVESHIMFINSLEKCLKDDNVDLSRDKSRSLIVMPLLIKLGENQAHYNFIIYNKQKNTLERFEPNGSNVFISQTPIIDHMFTTIQNGSLRKFILDNTQHTTGYRYIDPNNMCPNISGSEGFQLIESQEISMSSLDPGGFCLYWSMFYLDNRLKNPQIDNETLTIQLMNMINSRQGYTKFKNFIRSYAIFISLIESYLLSKDIELGTYDSVLEMNKLLKLLL